MSIAQTSPDPLEPASPDRDPPRQPDIRKGRAGSPRQRPRGSKSLAALLAKALNQTVVTTENGQRRKTTKREAILAHLVDKSADDDPRALKLLLDLMRALERERQAEAGPTPAPIFAPADEEIVALLIERLRRALRAELMQETALPRPGEGEPTS
jgi:hypothetical protein